jgi:hypothetical protein
VSPSSFLRGLVRPPYPLSPEHALYVFLLPLSFLLSFFLSFLLPFLLPFFLSFLLRPPLLPILLS